MPSLRAPAGFLRTGGFAFEYQVSPRLLNGELIELLHEGAGWGNPPTQQRPVDDPLGDAETHGHGVGTSARVHAKPKLTTIDVWGVRRRRQRPDAFGDWGVNKGPAFQPLSQLLNADFEGVGEREFAAQPP